MKAVAEDLFKGLNHEQEQVKKKLTVVRDGKIL